MKAWPKQRQIGVNWAISSLGMYLSCSIVNNILQIYFLERCMCTECFSNDLLHTPTQLFCSVGDSSFTA